LAEFLFRVQQFVSGLDAAAAAAAAAAAETIAVVVAVS
jgi:hypothetical protein